MSNVVFYAIISGNIVFVKRLDEKTRLINSRLNKKKKERNNHAQDV